MSLRTITLEELRLRCRQAADMERSQKVGESELDALINSSLGEFHDLLVGNREDWVHARLDLQLTGSAYSLPDDHWRTRGVDRLNGDGSTYPLKRIEWEDRGMRASSHDPWPFWSHGGDAANPGWNQEGDVLRFFPVGTAPGSVRLTYLPSSPVLTSASSSLGRPYTVNGWDEWIVQDVAAKMLTKEESDPSDRLRRRDEVAARIQAAAKRDETGARQVSFVRTGGACGPWLPRMR